MNREKFLYTLLTIGFGSACIYIGYIWGTSRMAAAYGEVMSAEAIMYLAVRDQED